MSNSYDDLLPLNYIDYCFETVMKWITSCTNFSQMKSAKNAIDLFKKQYPEQKALFQHLYRMYWKLRRDFIINN